MQRHASLPASSAPQAHVGPRFLLIAAAIILLAALATQIGGTGATVEITNPDQAILNWRGNSAHIPYQK